MLEEFVSKEAPELLTTYTRNPAVLRMLRHVANEIYPLENDAALQTVALDMPHSELDENGVTYHFNRYGEGGLFQGFDPADQPLTSEGLALKKSV